MQCVKYFLRNWIVFYLQTNKKAMFYKRFVPIWTKWKYKILYIIPLALYILSNISLSGILFWMKNILHVGICFKLSKKNHKILRVLRLFSWLALNHRTHRRKLWWELMKKNETLILLSVTVLKEIYTTKF